MKITQIEFIPYHYDFPRPLRLAKMQLSYREGYYIWLYEENGFLGIGEVAPLPGFSLESMKNVKKHLESLKRQLEHSAIKLDVHSGAVTGFPGLKKFPPSLKYGIEEALFDIAGQINHVSVSHLFEETPSEQIDCNGLIGLVDLKDIENEIQYIIAAGFTTVKVKVGRTDFREDLEILEAIRSQVGEYLKLRLDANESWSLEMAQQHLKDLEEFNVEYVEQPIPRGHINDLAKLRMNSKVLIAADEEIRSIKHLKHVLSKEAADIVVLKPMLLGGLTEAYVSAVTALSKDIKVVFTSSLETAIGRSGVCHLASALTPHLAHGLTAGSLLEPEILQDVYQAHKGSITVPEDPGLSIDLKPQDFNAIYE